MARSNRIANKARSLNGFLIPTANEMWVARTLNLQLNPNKGIDLLDDLVDTKYGLEVKFAFKGPLLPRNDYPNSWTVIEHQMKYSECVPTSYWALGLYQLDSYIKDLMVKTLEQIENHVIEREVWILPWNWMNQYLPSKVGFGNTFRYPKRKGIPHIIESYRVTGGTVHLTEGINPNNFKIKTSEVPF